MKNMSNTIFYFDSYSQPRFHREKTIIFLASYYPNYYLLLVSFTRIYTY